MTELPSAAPAGARPRAAVGCLLVFTKRAVPGQVKTRLVGALSAEQAAELHAAFLADLLARLAGSPAFGVTLAWSLAAGEPLPSQPALPAMRQDGGDLGERLARALAAAAATHPWVAAVGSDHPTLSRARVEEAFAALAGGAPVVLGPASDGGYYLVGVRREALSPRLFADIPWSGPEVLARTLERCRELAITPHLLAVESDVDTPADLRGLTGELARDPAASPATARLLASWGMLGPAPATPAVAVPPTTP